MHSPTEENYLKALYLLAGEKGSATITDISRQLNIKMPTVNSMMKKLQEKGLVQYESYKPLQLTSKGRKEAALIIRKHRLTEMFLVEKMGFAWDEVHEIAEQVEHIQSARFFEKMDELLGHPSFDPHGSPIPDAKGVISSTGFKKLSDVSRGERVRLAAVANSSSEFLRFLNERGLKLGLELEVVSTAAYDGSMVVTYTGHDQENLSSLICGSLLVKAV